MDEQSCFLNLCKANVWDATTHAKKKKKNQKKSII